MVFILSPEIILQLIFDYINLGMTKFESLFNGFKKNINPTKISLDSISSRFILNNSLSVIYLYANARILYPFIEY